MAGDSRGHSRQADVVDENVSRFLSSYYADDENRYHSLPRYFGGTLKRDKEKSYVRSKSIVHSTSGTTLNSSYDGRKPDTSEMVKELKSYLRNSPKKYNSIPSYPSASRRHSMRHDDSSSEISSHSYKSSKTHEYYPENEDFEYFEDDVVAEKSEKRKSKFFRTSSIRSLKKIVNKLRGKKTNQHGGAAPLAHHHHHNQFQGPPQSQHHQSGGSFSRNGVYATTRNSHSGALNVESGINTPSDSASWNGPPPKAAPTPYALAAAEIATPALCGISNHGNTCYINAVVQCLSNTDVLAEYFLTNAYFTDLCQNQKNADKYGSHGNLTVALAKIIASLWYKTYSPKLSEQFQQVVEQYSEQYRGGQQQDAQEFFIWLLDRVHEDLNIGVKRRYQLRRPRNKSEDEIASVAMEKHLEAHNSFVSYHFHGLYLSSVTCPVCYKQSTQADPLSCVSLPVSQSTKKPLYVIVVFLNAKPRLLCFGLNADITATFFEVKHCLAKATDLQTEQLVLCELDQNGFMQSFADDHDISCLSASTKCIYAFETPPLYTPSTSNRTAADFTTSTEVGEELICLICNQVGVGSATGRKFGTPTALKVHREVSYGDLCRSVLLSIRSQLRANVLVQEIPHGVFKLRVVDDYHLLAYIPQDVSMPMYSQAVDNALSSQTKKAGPVHIKIMVEWQREAKERFFNPVEDTVVDHKSAQDLKHQENFPETQTLHECLEEFTKDESLSWYCHDCRRHQERAVKRTLFYWLPNILTLHLKRNKQLPNGQLVKLDPLVKFPIYGLDLSEFMHQPSPGTPRKKSSNGYRINRAKNGELYVDTNTSRCVYDLFAVVNHHGESSNSGHYTAYCRNPVNGNWYWFDDQNVTRTDETRLVTNAAYLLFYERRLSRNVNSCSNSTESGFVDHWYFKLYFSRFDHQRLPTSGGSRDTLEGVDSGHSTNGSSNTRESPERPPSRRMFVALPPVASPEATTPLSNGRTEPPVGRLISIDAVPTPPVRTSSALRQITNDDADDRRTYVNQEYINRHSSEVSSNFVRQQSYARRIRTNSVFETDL